MSSERDEMKWVQYVKVYGQTSDWSEPPPVSVDAADVQSMVAKDEVTNYFIQMDAAEAAMQSWFRRYCDVAVYDSVIVEMPDPTAEATSMIEEVAGYGATIAGVDERAWELLEAKYLAAARRFGLEASALTDVARWNDDNVTGVEDE